MAGDNHQSHSTGDYAPDSDLTENQGYVFWCQEQSGRGQRENENQDSESYKKSLLFPDADYL